MYQIKYTDPIGDGLAKNHGEPWQDREAAIAEAKILCAALANRWVIVFDQKTGISVFSERND